MSAIGIELVVEDLDRAVELFVAVLGFPLISRGPAALVAGEVASVDAGSIVINLLRPAPSGPDSLISHRHARLSQIIFGGTGPAALPAMFERAVTAGLSLTDLPDGRFAIVADAVRGAIGLDVAVVAVPLDAE